MLLIADKLDILFILPAPGNIGEVLNDCPTLHLHHLHPVASLPLRLLFNAMFSIWTMRESHHDQEEMIVVL